MAKGWKMSLEQRKRLSDAHKGQIAWSKGKIGIYSEETRKKIGLASKGRIPWNKNLQRVTVSGMKGKHHSKETRKKILFIFKNNETFKS